MRKPKAVRLVGIMFIVCAAAAVSARAQTFNKLYNFCTLPDCPDGLRPYAAMTQGTDGSFYGTAYEGGAHGDGIVFKIAAGGHLTTLYSFCSLSSCADGYSPIAGLVQGKDGNFYGTALRGGITNSVCTYGCGTVFKITPEGSLTTLHSFCSDPRCADGLAPFSTLVQGTDGNFYGTTAGGGASAQCEAGCGTIFKMTPTGSLTTLYNFCYQQNCTEGVGAYAGLMQASDGNFYGVTEYSGNSNCGYYGCGTVFKVSPAGTLTTLYTFCSQANCTDGSFPNLSLVQAADGSLYGTTAGGGTSTNCDGSGCGTVFSITTSGELTTLYSFCLKSNCPDGVQPYAGVVQGTDGNFYGTTAYGGIGNDGGTVFKLTSEGALTTLYSFCSEEYCWDGNVPDAALVQATSGIFYGTTEEGGKTEYCYEGEEAGCGTVFTISVGLRPSVETRPTSGKVGSDVFILGNNLTGATSVTFNGTAASFTVASGTLIEATVPAGATSGYVRVTVPKEELKSNIAFVITQ